MRKGKKLHQKKFKAAIEEGEKKSYPAGKRGAAGAELY